MKYTLTRDEGTVTLAKAQPLSVVVGMIVAEIEKAQKAHEIFPHRPAYTPDLMVSVVPDEKKHGY